MGKENKVESYVGVLKLAEKQAKADADKIRPVLEKDPDWPLASGRQVPSTTEERKRERRALTRLTKKAANLLFPEYKTLARYDSGTARNWVHVNILSPEKFDHEKRRKIEQRVENMLLATGLKYASYYTDYGMGLDHYAPCLHIEVNHHYWKHL